MMPGMPGRPEPDEEMNELMRADAELEHKTLLLASRYQAARSEQKSELKQELAETINKHFDVRQKKRELQVKRMEESLDKLREAIRKRAEAREEIESKRLGQLTGDRSDLEF